MDKDLVDKIIEKRIIAMTKKIPCKKLGIKEFYIGGGCLNKGIPNDIDIYPVKKDGFVKVLDKISKQNSINLISHTNNAITIEGNPPIQLCNYYHRSLKELVDSFDFAHIQLGGKVLINNKGYIEVIEMYYTDDYVTSHITGNTYYTSSEYPLSSLIRLNKYVKRGEYLGRTYIIDSIMILGDIISRGYNGYEDFKDQLDAVDLGLLPEEFTEINDSYIYLMRLFELLDKGEE